MHKLFSRVRKGLSGILAAALIGSCMTATAFADTTTLTAGTYEADATLSCYVEAMGGVEFSDGYGLLKSSSVTVNEDGDAALTLNLGTTSGLSIYGVACTAFIGTDEAPGYYKDGAVTTEGVTYTVSEATASNANGEVNYIDSITFPVDPETTEYTMWLYLDSNVMGCQLGDGSGTGASNTPGVATKHTAKVTLNFDWDSISSTGSGSTGSGSTGSGSTDSGSTDSGSTGSGSTDSGSTDSGSTGSGSTSSSSGDKYTADMTLSCYVNAMGGVEFADGYGLLKSGYVVKDENGDYEATLNLGTTSGLSIYGVACTAFIGIDEAPGYYKNGTVTTDGVSYTKSDDTVANANGQVKYITSITFPVSEEEDDYTMWLYLDSNVMGCQLGDGSGSGASNTPGAATAHTATLTIDWDSLEAANTTRVEKYEASATVEYVVENTYEVAIPTEITVNSVTKKGAYEVEAVYVPADGYMVVTADSEGTLTSGSKSVTFTNVLSQPEDSETTGTKLEKTGDYLEGLVTVTGKASSKGTYTGTINFTINCY